MGLFRRTPKSVVKLVPFGTRHHLRDIATPQIAADELNIALVNSGLEFVGVFPDVTGVDVQFESIEDAEVFLHRVFDDGQPRPGTMQDRATEGCVGVRADLGDIRPGGQPSWTWDIHPSWDEGVFVWHIDLNIPLDDALTVIATINSKSHGDSL